MINAIFEDIRVILLIIFLIIIFGAVFAALKDDVDSPEAKQVLEDTQKSFFLSMNIVLWGISIIGSLGFILLIVSLFRNNSF